MKTEYLFKVLNFLVWLLKIYTLFVMLWLFVTAVSKMEYPAQIQYNPESALSQDSAGRGFATLTDYLSLWKTLRNIGYMFTIFLTLYSGAIGALLSFTKKPTTPFKSPITTMVLNTLLLTFSYALVGLSIDIIYLAYFVSKSY